MQLTMESAVTQYYVLNNNSPVTAAEVLQLKKAFRAESESRKQELATAAALAMRIPKSEWSWLTSQHAVRWDLDEMAKYRHDLGDSVCDFFLGRFRNETCPKTRALAWVTIFDMTWGPIPMVSPSMLHHVKTELLRFLRTEDNANTLRFIRMHLSCLCKSSDLEGDRAHPYMQPSNN